MEDKQLATNEAKELVKANSIADMDEFQSMDDADTIAIPRLVLVQGGLNHQAVKDGLAKDGDLINSLNKDNYGSSIEVVPLLQMPSSRIRWKARGSGGGMLCIARDGKHGSGDPGDSLQNNECVHCPFYSSRKPQGGPGVQKADDEGWCSSNYQIVALVRDTKEAIMLAADSIKSADAGIRDMLGMARLNANKGLRMFQKSYILKAVPASSNGFNFYKTTCVPGNNNKPLDENEVEFMRGQMQFFKTAKVNVEHDDRPVANAPAEEAKDW